MAIAVISSELRTSTGNITIPANCDFVVALVSGQTNPTINLVNMSQAISKNNGPTYVSISTMAEPPTGTIGCTVGQSTRFVYLSDGGAVRDADGSATGGASTLTSSATDMIFGIQGGVPLIGGEMTVDGSSMTILDNANTYTRGYLAAPDDSVICDGDGNVNAFVSIMDTASLSPGDGTMISWIN